MEVLLYVSYISYISYIVRDTYCGMWGLGPELGLEGHHYIPGRETEGESVYTYRLCCARARCGAGLAAAVPLARGSARGVCHIRATGASFCG
jgi:hypothetical protein